MDIFNFILGIVSFVFMLAGGIIFILGVISGDTNQLIAGGVIAIMNQAVLNNLDA